MGRWSMVLVVLATAAGLAFAWPQLRRSNVGKLLSGQCEYHGGRGLDCGSKTSPYFP